MNPHRLLDAVLHEEPAHALTALQQLRELLDHHEHEHVIALRQRGYTWAHIGRLLGITRQAAREHFIHWDPTQTWPETSQSCHDSHELDALGERQVRRSS